ncbi:flagellar basal body rod protein FlgB [Heliorestis convoluta]|uniref:Flagellar basal body rod protein FlgB n=1 Tax=Heliorestis convoluta TaxID=356322 RepID=A0A5Q2MYX4_9FIRM|nr:flagellar basal body rod protein FlgB [Heliorestis convoluta]QGG48164.1 flagellar basal-body rod protein FlgB [Heliorestis convoluta]
MRFFDTASTNLLEKGLDAAALRHRVIADNIANVDTPGYKRKEVHFEQELAQKLSHSSMMRLEGTVNNKRHISLGHFSTDNLKGNIIDTGQQKYRNDENNVDIDKEMTMLAKNTLWYDAMLTQIARRLSGLKTVIKEVR